MLESAEEMNQRRSSALATDNSFQEDNNSAQSAWGSQPAKPSFSNDGLLIGRPGSIDGAHSSIELDNLVARELREWRNEVTASSGQDLRQRKPGSGHGAMDEVKFLLLVLIFLNQVQTLAIPPSLSIPFLILRFLLSALMCCSILGLCRPQRHQTQYSHFLRQPRLP
jgi:hypothetical protein